VSTVFNSTVGNTGRYNPVTVTELLGSWDFNPSETGNITQLLAAGEVSFSVVSTYNNTRFFHQGRFVAIPQLKN
jgi:hypothetical protein